MMIIGHGKSEQITNEPLLEWNMEIFQRILNKKNTKLLIIGYSFRDKHINQLIYENRISIDIHIINPQPLNTFLDTLMPQPFGPEIKTLIKKYYPITLQKLIGLNSGEPHYYWDILQTEFFNRTYY
jgi:hypothetical protein